MERGNTAKHGRVSRMAYWWVKVRVEAVVEVSGGDGDFNVDIMHDEYDM